MNIFRNSFVFLKRQHKLIVASVNNSVQLATTKFLALQLCSPNATTFNNKAGVEELAGRTPQLTVVCVSSIGRHEAPLPIQWSHNIPEHITLSVTLP